MKTWQIFIIVFALVACNQTAFTQFALDLEGGVAVTGYNDIRIPGDSGTFIKLPDELSSDPFPFGRARLSYTFKERNTIMVLFAPLRVSYDGTINKDVNYQNTIFPAGTPIDATYKFNSYRITYRYRVLKRESTNLGLGLTVKVRDAFIRLEGGGLRAVKDDLGFVPLINFRFDWQLNPRLYLLVDGDALAAPQGRAEDVLIAIGYALNERFDIFTGYRILEGGADNDEVYTFSLFHYGVLGVRIHL